MLEHDSAASGDGDRVCELNDGRNARARLESGRYCRGATWERRRDAACARAESILAVA